MDIWPRVLMVLMLITAVFLILLVLVQRGKGGGLAGAFGGLGGQSAFGTKAGDLFTRVTIGVATFWIILCMFTVWMLGGSTDLLRPGTGGPNQVQQTAPAAPSTDTPPDRSSQQTPAGATQPAGGQDSGGS